MNKNISDQVDNTIHDLVSNFVYYDRKGDEDLSIDDLNDLFESGELTVDMCVNSFRKHLENRFQ